MFMTKSTESTAELKLPLWKANFWFAVLWLMMFFDMVDRYTLAACLPYIKQTFQLTDTQSGVIASAFSIAIVVLVIPVSLIAHKWSRRKVLSIMVAIWSIATFLSGQAKGYGTLFAARLGIGAGEAGYLPTAEALLTAWYPKDKRGLVLGIFNSAVSAGATLGLMLSGWLAFTYGWRACFGIVAIPGIILAVLGWFMPDFKNDVKSKVEEIEQANAAASPSASPELKTGIKDVAWYVVTSPAVLTSVVVSGLIGLAGTIMSIWGVTLFTRTFNMNVKEAATFIGFIGMFAMFIPIIIGFFSDKLIKNNPKGRLNGTIIGICVFIACILIFTQNSLHAQSLVIAFFTWGIAKGCINGSQSVVNTVTQDLLPPHYRTAASSLIPISNQGIGGVLGPILCGVFSDMFNISTAIVIVAAIGSLAVIIATLICKKFYDKDDDKLRRMGTFNLERA